jgi:thymidylate synthase
MQEYLDQMQILLSKPPRENRTGIDASGVMFARTKFDLAQGAFYPAVTSKPLAVKGVLGELIGFMKGVTNAEDFRKLGCRVWDDNANNNGVNPNPWLSNPNRIGTDDLGRIYGAQWRRWQDTQTVLEGYDSHMPAAGYDYVGRIFRAGSKDLQVWNREIDQLQDAIDNIKNKPDNRRILISGWNPSDMDKMALPPCHLLQHWLCDVMTVSERIQAELVRRYNILLWDNEASEINFANDVQLGLSEEVDNMCDEHNSDSPTHAVLDDLNIPKHKLCLNMYQRSCDYMLGAPFNIASYAAMLLVMARLTNTVPGTFEYLTGDTHLYGNHKAAAIEQIARGPIEGSKPRLLINPAITTLDDVEKVTDPYTMFKLLDYNHKGKLSNATPMAI